MQTNIFKKIPVTITGVLAICCFLLFGSLQPKDKDPDFAVRNCCKGYIIPINKLHQFMLDSLKSGKFEGGVFSKKDLLKAINGISGESVYMMNAVIDCLLGKGNGMFITSPETGDVKIISTNPYCAPCPGKACCPQRICASVIKRACLTYRRYDAPGADITASDELAVQACCKGYIIPMDQLRQFMLDSLKKGKFEGGIFPRKDLLKAINNITDDSVYMMNAVLDCLLNEGNGMIITSPTGGLMIVSKDPYCPCPKPCCPQRICASVINRACLSSRLFDEPADIAANE